MNRNIVHTLLKTIDKPMGKRAFYPCENIKFAPFQKRILNYFSQEKL
jgi:hypothetical protein